MVEFLLLRSFIERVFHPAFSTWSMAWGFIRTGIDEGAEAIAGGAEAPKFETGYFVQPMILGIKAGDTLAQEEI